MATNRTTIPRPRRSAFDGDALWLFRALEGVPRSHPEFKDKSLRLAVLLDLSDEWWMMQHVNDCSSEPCHPPGMLAFDAWHRCRAVRELLLEACGKVA